MSAGFQWGRGRCPTLGGWEPLGDAGREPLHLAAERGRERDRQTDRERQKGRERERDTSAV